MYQPTPHIQAQIDTAFSYHEPQGDQSCRYVKIRREANRLANIIAQNTPPSREQSIALTKLEECVMFANSAIARHEVFDDNGELQSKGGENDLRRFGSAGY